ncbi:MAG: hypothetical protein ACI82S_003194 [Patiriisocius sp.]|jgi:hypothetical protein
MCASVLMCETETSCNPRFTILIFCQNFAKVETEKIQDLIVTIIQYINVWNSKLADKRTSRNRSQQTVSVFY